MNDTERISPKERFINLILSPEISILIPLVILCIYTGIVKPNFWNIKNIQAIIRYTAFVGSLAIGEAFALMCGEIDLSIGTVSALSACVMASLIGWKGFSVPVGILAALLTGVIAGSTNALFTLKFKMSSWIVTMACQYICSGFATVICQGKAIGGLGPFVQMVNQARPLGISYMFFVFLAFIIVTEILVRYTTVGSYVHAVGLSVPSARIAGINVNKVKTLCFIFASFMGSVCGILQVFMNNAANATVGKGTEFNAVISCVIGGVGAAGGKGTMLGVLIGVFMFQTLKNCLQTLGFSANSQLVLTGILLVLAVLVDVIKVKINTRKRVLKK